MDYTLDIFKLKKIFLYEKEQVFVHFIYSLDLVPGKRISKKGRNKTAFFNLQFSLF